MDNKNVLNTLIEIVLKNIKRNFDANI